MIIELEEQIGFHRKQCLDCTNKLAQMFGNNVEAKNLLEYELKMQCIEYHIYDICIGSLGMSAWERIYVGLPSICVVIAENQRLVSEVLSDRRVILLADENNLEERVADIFKYPKLRFELFTNSLRVLNGNSTQALAKKLNDIIEN